MNDSGAWVGHSIEFRPMPECANEKLKDVVREGEEGAERRRTAMMVGGLSTGRISSIIEKI
jgi:hypothetical protein